MFAKEKPPVHTPFIEVLGITQMSMTKSVTKVVEYYGRGINNDTGTTVEGEPYTIVLYTSDGELQTKRFPGIWALKDVQKWNPKQWLTS